MNGSNKHDIYIIIVRTSFCNISFQHMCQMHEMVQMWKLHSKDTVLTIYTIKGNWIYIHRIGLAFCKTYIARRIVGSSNCVYICIETVLWHVCKVGERVLCTWIKLNGLGYPYMKGTKRTVAATGFWTAKKSHI